MGMNKVLEQQSSSMEAAALDEIVSENDVVEEEENPLAEEDMLGNLEEDMFGGLERRTSQL